MPGLLTLFSFQGRIGRLQFLLAIVAAAMIAFVAEALTQSIMLGGVAETAPSQNTGFNIGGALNRDEDPQGVSTRVSRILVLVLLIGWTVVPLWIHLAALIKRLRDLGRSGWNVVWIVVIPSLLLVVGIATIEYEAGGGLVVLSMGVMLAIVLWLLLAPGKVEGVENF